MQKLVEFLRFGSSIPGGYWGCCAVDIIQCFKSDPDEKASIQMVAGDGGQPCTKDGESLFAGPTNRDVFMQRLRVGTFGVRDMPNHAFIAVLTEDQIVGVYGSKWLKILKETGFEFIRSVSNSVYTGNTLAAHNPNNVGQSVNHIFMLVRNIGSGAIGDPYTPPKAWTDLPEIVPEAWGLYDETTAELAARQHKAQTEIWNKIGPAKFLTEAEVVAAGAPVILAGKRSDNPQEEKSVREARQSATPAPKVAAQPMWN